MQTESIFSVCFTFLLCYATFFLSISDAGFRIMLKDICKTILIISIGRLLVETIGAVLEFRRKSKQEKDNED